MIRFENIQARDHPKSLNELIERSTPQFLTDSLSSTHQFHGKATPFQHPKSLSSTLKTPQFNTKNPLVNTKIPRFYTENPSVPHKKPLSSTPKTPQFQTLLSSIPKTPQFNTGVCGTRAFPV